VWFCSCCFGCISMLYFFGYK